MRERNELGPRVDGNEELRRYLSEHIALTSREEVLANLVQALILADDASELPLEERQIMILGLMEFRPGNEELFLQAALYWPPDENVVSKDALIGLMTPGYHIDFVVQTLEQAWAEDDHKYDGLVDLFYETQAHLAWLAMLRLDGVGERKRDQLYERLQEVLHPYNDYYRTRPDELPPGTREGLHEVLVEYSQDDSLWARVFVAEILNKVPYMRDPAIEAALRDDPHWLIQRRMAYLDEEEEPDSETTDER